MKNGSILILLASAGAFGFCAQVRAEEFHKLTGDQIRAKLIGRQLTDESHWGEVYWPNGHLTSDEMGNKRVGSWRIVKNQLCKSYPDDIGNACFDVWVSGNSVQMKIPGSTDFPFEGVLIKAPRHE